MTERERLQNNLEELRKDLASSQEELANLQEEKEEVERKIDKAERDSLEEQQWKVLLDDDIQLNIERLELEINNIETEISRTEAELEELTDTGKLIPQRRSKGNKNHRVLVERIGLKYLMNAYDIQLAGRGDYFIDLGEIYIQNKLMEDLLEGVITREDTSDLVLLNHQLGTRDFLSSEQIGIELEELLLKIFAGWEIKATVIKRIYPISREDHQLTEFEILLDWPVWVETRKFADIEVVFKGELNLAWEYYKQAKTEEGKKYGLVM